MKLSMPVNIFWYLPSFVVFFYLTDLHLWFVQDECDLDMIGAPLAACVCQILANQLSSNLFPKEQDEE